MVNMKLTMSKAEHMLNWVKNGVYGAALKISLRGVPYLLIEREGIVYSVSYFGKSKKFRVFYPFMSNKQSKFDLKTRKNVIDFFQPKKAEVL